MKHRTKKETLYTNNSDSLETEGSSRSPKREKSENNTTDGLLTRESLVNFIETNEVLNTNAFNSSGIKEGGDKFVESFWYWTRFSSYLSCLAMIIGIMSILTFAFKSNVVFVAMLGTLSSSVEAMIAVPQLYLNYQNKSTHGLSKLLIAMWIFGDCYKLSYYFGFDSPIQLKTCSMFQICIDFGILY